MIRFWSLNVSGALAFMAAWVAGWASRPFTQDPTYLTWLIASIFLWGLFLAHQSRWEAVRWISGRLVRLGLVGTLVGFVIALSGVDWSHAGDVAQIPHMVGAMVSGLSVAIYTSLAGWIGSLWLDLNRRLLGD